MQEYFAEWSALIIPWVLSHGIKILIIIVGAYFLNKIAIKFVERAVRIAITPEGIASEDGETKREDTLIRIFSATLTVSILTIAVLMVFQELGMMIGPILAGAGIIGLAFGFGGQYLIRDIISGLFIILENQYRIGDVVKFEDVGGTVENISLRMTTLRDLDGTVHHVPHGEIKKVSNLSKYFARVNLNIGVAYDSNLEHVIEIVNQAGKELAEDPKWKHLILKAPQFLRVDDLGDSSVVIKVLGETKPLKQWEVTGELRKRIKVAFDTAGIEIPFPQRVVHQIKPAE